MSQKDANNNHKIMYISIGLALGIGLGVALDNLALGIALGFLVGAMGASINLTKKNK